MSVPTGEVTAAVPGPSATGVTASAATARLRWRLVASTCVVVVLGLAVTRFPSSEGAVAGVVDAVGDVLYAVMMVLLVTFVAPRATLWVSASVAFFICAAVEVAQLTGGPAALVEAWAPARYLLGTTFTLTDLAAYAAGAGFGAFAVVRLRMATSGRRDTCSDSLVSGPSRPATGDRSQQT